VQAIKRRVLAVGWLVGLFVNAAAGDQTGPVEDVCVCV